MTRRQRTIAVRVHVLVLSALVVSTPLVGAPQESPMAKPQPGKGEPGADSESLREAARIIAAVDLEISTGDAWGKVKQIEKPLLLYGDLTRDNDRGSLWAWGEKGRPVALLELFQDTVNRQKWLFAVCNTSGSKLRGRWVDAPWWGENTSATEPRDIPGAPPPAATTAQRQRQMKQLAQKFAGHEFWDPNNTRYDLRLLDRPLHTYRDEAAGLLDGGLFTFANGTNPEIMLYIEARVSPNDKTKTVWQYATGRLAHAELHLAYNGKELFTAPRADSSISDRELPYWLGFFTVTPGLLPK
ncbi:hypothetical protein [Fimbriiglobus ruber]|uniref:Uncharacterized protein n=1 Tax=Fimbriiglobus ruber TaxID=1908690 RepID=A0A225D577_9BACT|nr:hypothetical protein [Fimbriiglobus ruber]OWK36730.1 hypothetical protein FRUB_09293 [Fimbriiglobus ruber]